ncbi:MAG TPA: class I SAM-dependent methyltransferase [Gemmatimonadales bacterium]|nr:class I SAM-dependent methyltransferase [Gemmatimonadales bacterium]
MLGAAGHDGWCIDHFAEGNTPGEWRNNLPADWQHVRLICADLTCVPEKVPGNLALLHLDADHSYRATKLAFDLYAHKVRPGGHMVIHDAWPTLEAAYNLWPETTRFVADLIRRTVDWEIVCNAGRSAAFRKR